METAALAYQEFLSRDWYYLMTIRNLGDWQILSTSESAESEENLGRADSRVYLLLLVNPTQETVIECRYDTWQERYRDVDLLKRLPPGGKAEAGMPAWLRPLLPTIAGTDAKPLPQTNDRERS